MRDAEDRAWELVRRAFEERAPRPRHTGRWAAVALVAVAAAVAAAVVSPPGRAVFQRVRAAVGVAGADPALFSLPDRGRLLVVSAGGGGTWLVRDNGFKRRLGPYDDASWSPYGRYVVTTAGDRLLALDGDGRIRWSLTRAGVASPRWTGSRTDTRIAYLADTGPARTGPARTGLRVVAGDGSGDHLLDAAAAPVAPAWVPGTFDVTYATTRGGVLTRAADSGALRRRTRVGGVARSLQWSDDGRLLAVTFARRVVVLDARGRTVRTIGTLGGIITQSAFRPRSHLLAVVVRRDARSELKLVNVDAPGNARLLFAGPGVFGDIAWSPRGNSLLVGWPTADQWIFLRGRKVHAVGNIRAEFPRRDDVPPRLRFAGRWCCR